MDNEVEYRGCCIAFSFMPDEPDDIKFVYVHSLSTMQMLGKGRFDYLIYEDVIKGVKQWIDKNLECDDAPFPGSPQRITF